MECTDSPDGPEPLTLTRIETLINFALAKISRNLDNPCPSTQATLLETVAHGQVVKRYDHRGHLVVPVREKKRVKRKALAGLHKEVMVVPADAQGENGRTLQKEIERKYIEEFGERWAPQEEKENLDSGLILDQFEREESAEREMERMSSPVAPPTQTFGESALAAKVSGGSRALWNQVGENPQPFRWTEDGRSGGSSFGGTNRQSAEQDEGEDELDAQPEEVEPGQKRRKLDDRSGIYGQWRAGDGAARFGGLRSSFLAGRSSGGTRLWDASGA